MNKWAVYFEKTISYVFLSSLSLASRIKSILVSLLFDWTFKMNDSSSNDSSSDLHENLLFTHVLSILLLIVMLIGLVGNLLVIYVLCNYSRLKTVTNTYLLHLALSDLVFLSGAPFFISSIITRSWIFGRFVCKLFFLTQGVNQYTSIIILAFLSFDRFLAVCHSAKSIRWRSRVHPHLLLVFAWVFSFLLMLPIVIFTTLHESVESNVQCIILLPLPESRLPYLIFVAYTSTITFFLPLIFMIYFYLKIVHRLQYRVPRQHRRSRTSIRTRRKVTVLVLSVISVHVICCSPYWTFQMITTTELLPQSSPILIPTSSITQFLLFVNSSTNPILYAFISEIFRLSFKRVFHCCLSTTTMDEQYIQEKTIAKRNPMLTAKKNHTLATKAVCSTGMPTTDQQLPRLTIDSTQRSSLTIKENTETLLHRQNRLLSLAPTISVFNSETSFVSDI